MKIFLSPHNDDESLFGAFTLLRERPHVIVVMKTSSQTKRAKITSDVRETETEAALQILGCTWEQWCYPDDDPDWFDLQLQFLHLRERNLEKIWAPAWCQGGHVQHNQIGSMINNIFSDRAQFYTTYRRLPQYERQIGEIEVPVEDWMVSKKLAALACYESQHGQTIARPHFMEPLAEYYSGDFFGTEEKPAALATGAKTCDGCFGTGTKWDVPELG